MAAWTPHTAPSQEYTLLSNNFTNWVNYGG